MYSLSYSMMSVVTDSKSEGGHNLFIKPLNEVIVVTDSKSEGGHN